MHAPQLKTHKEYNSEDKKRVLTKALLRMAERLEISRPELSTIIGYSEPSLSRLYNQPHRYIDPASNEGRLTILLLRLYRSLDSLFGGNAKQCRLWLRSDNNHVHGKPIEVIQSIEGLTIVIEYLDAMRGKN